MLGEGGMLVLNAATREQSQKCESVDIGVGDIFVDLLHLAHYKSNSWPVNWKSFTTLTFPMLATYTMSNLEIPSTGS